MNETVLTIVFVVGVTAFFSYISYRQKKSSWTGELIDKKYIEADTDDDSSTPEKYILVGVISIGGFLFFFFLLN